MSAGAAGAAAQGFKSFIRKSALRAIPKPVEPIPNWHIVRGDTVVVLRGRDKGKSGKVTSVQRSRNRVVIEGVNMVRKHVRPTDGTAGGVISVEAPLHYSAVNLADPVSGKPTRVSLRFTEEGARVRIAKRSGSIIAAPPEAKVRRTPRSPAAGPKDTAADAAGKQTFFPAAELAAALGGGGDLYRVRTAADGDKLPEVLRLKLRRKDRNRLRRKWESALARRKAAAASGAAEAAMAAGLGSAAPRAAPAAATAELR